MITTHSPDKNRSPNGHRLPLLAAAPKIDGVSHTPGLPSALILLEQAGGILRSFVKARRFEGWQCFFPRNSVLNRIDEFLKPLGEADASWMPFGSFTRGGHHLTEYYFESPPDDRDVQPPGFLWLKKHQVILFRWVNPLLPDQRVTIEMAAAAPSPECLDQLLREIISHRLSAAQEVWQMLGDDRQDQELPRKAGLGLDDLVLPNAVRQRLLTEVVDFFSPATRQIYADLQIPHRRGVLMHGPPGNGKTSIIRAIGSLVDRVAALILRPGRNFDDSDLTQAIRQWRKQAPAILVIEDLDWMLSRISLSTFLNQVDGIDQRDNGLLLMATTNHPGELDPAVNNRPGRFDVVIEIPSPSENQRLDYFTRHSLKGLQPAFLGGLAAHTSGLSFAHLREIENLSGLLALRNNRRERSVEDVREAMQIVNTTHTHARRGFPERRRTAGFVAENDD